MEMEVDVEMEVETVLINNKFNMEACEDIKRNYKPKADTVKGQDDYNNYNGIYTCVECGKDFLGREDTFVCQHCLNEFY